MRIDIHDADQKHRFRVQVDPNDPPSVVRAPDAPHDEAYLDWDGAVDDEGHLRRCCVCGCRELFVRRDFPQLTGFIIVVLAAVVSLFLFASDQALLAMVVLGVVVVLDVVILLFTGRCQVCYRCRSEFRDAPIPRDQKPWQLAIGEKYRQQRLEAERSE